MSSIQSMTRPQWTAQSRIRRASGLFPPQRIRAATTSSMSISMPSRFCSRLPMAVLSPPRAVKVAALSMRVTRTPVSAAETAAASPAVPAPTTRTSVSNACPGERTACTAGPAATGRPRSIPVKTAAPAAALRRNVLRLGCAPAVCFALKMTPSHGL